MSAGAPARRPDPEAIREAPGEAPGVPNGTGEGDVEAPESDLRELLVLARRCPACSSRLNVRVTVALREFLQEAAEPSLPVGTVLCKAYHHPGGVCGELVELTAADVQRARRP